MRPIIQTKLNVPRLQSNHFSRSRLLDKIDVDHKGNLILVSAPAGYGKTTLISEWTSKNLDSCAWYSLSNEDNNVITFVNYLVESLKKIDDRIGDKVMKEIELMDSLGIENLFASLINDFIKCNEDITFVLDDYHLINNPEIQKGVNTILEHIPDNTRVIIITRNQDCVPTTKLRAKNRLLEINMNDLLFDFDEISVFLNEYLHQKLSYESISFIQQKTEGWVTSLHLFALSLLRQDDPTEFIESFSGQEDYIFDYLLEEVFKQQPIGIRKYLMITSLFGRFNSSMAASVLEKPEDEAREILNEIINSNLFIVSIDNEKKWYRYHQLFQEFLQKKFDDIGLKESLVLEIYEFASTWFEREGFAYEAIESAIKAKKFNHAAELMEKEWIARGQQIDPSIMQKWSEQLPDSVFTNKLVLNIGYAWALLSEGNYVTTKKYMERASVLFDEYISQDNSKKGSDEDVTEMLPSLIYGAKAYVYIMERNEEQAYNYAKRASEVVPKKHTYRKKVIRTILALSLWGLGRLDEALKTLYMYTSLENRSLQNPFFIGKILTNKGKLHLSQEHYKQILEVKGPKRQYLEPTFASLYHELALINYYQGKYEEAKLNLQKSLDVVRPEFIKTWEYYYHKIHALVLMNEFKYEKALNELRRAESNFQNSPLGDVESIDALKVNLYIRQRKTSLIFDYIDRFGIVTPKLVPFLEENNYLTLVKCLIYKFKYHKDMMSLSTAKEITDLLLEQFRKNNRVTKVVEAIILDIEIQLLSGFRSLATDLLQEAIELAMIENYVNPFVESAACIKTLLTDDTLEWQHKEFVLIIIKEINQSLKLKEQVLNPSKMNQLVAPLSKRELEVLELISRGLTNDEISKTLFLALSTIKNYNQSLFTKLQVKNRIEAIKKASEIGII